MSNDDLQVDAGDEVQPVARDDVADEAGESDVEEERLSHLRWRIGRNLERRIDQYLVDRVGYLSRAQVQRLIEDGFVAVNSRKTKSSYRPRLNDIVEIWAPPPRAALIEPEPIPLDVIFEDDHLLAINKQADLIIHPARGQWHGTLVNGLIHYGQKWSTVNGEWRPGILHRLDRNTTGIMLVAKSDEAHWRMARQFENRTLQKQYVAVVQGIPQLLGDVIDKPIGKDRYVRERQAIRREEDGGKPAITRYETLERFQSAPGNELPPPGSFAFVRLFPKTGRTHQLRVHMSHIGHPMVGDTMYGGRVVEVGDFRFDRQALHAEQITFTHPVTLQEMTLSAPLPDDMRRLLALLRGK